jgi:hypothetical protein
MSTIVAPTPEQWTVLEALGLTDPGSFLLVSPSNAEALRDERGLTLTHGQAVEAYTGPGEDDVFIAFVSSDTRITDDLVEELNGADGADPIRMV